MEHAHTHAEIVHVPTYDSSIGVTGWHDVSEVVEVRVSSDDVRIFANESGLRGLARELLSLAQEGVPDGSEVYLTAKGQAPTLVDGSVSLRFVRHGSSEVDGKEAFQSRS
jgi:hypothetical protein